MAVKNAEVAVGTTATRLDVNAETDSGGSSNAAAAKYGSTLVLTVPSTIYVGGTNAIAASGNAPNATPTPGNKGFPLPAGTWTFDVSGNDALYAIVGSGTVTVQVLQTGV